MNMVHQLARVIVQKHSLCVLEYVALLMRYSHEGYRTPCDGLLYPIRNATSYALGHRAAWMVGKNVHSPFGIINNKVIDNKGKELICYPEVHGILSRLYTNGCKLAIASRIEDIPGAYQLLQLFDINSFFHYKEIYPMSKSVHFLQLHMKSGVQFKDMIFFDDNKCNLETRPAAQLKCEGLSPSGLTTEHCNLGVTLPVTGPQGLRQRVHQVPVWGCHSSPGNPVRRPCRDCLAIRQKLMLQWIETIPSRRLKSNDLTDQYWDTRRQIEEF
ncbi:unnamed protein product [Timema podura]|uniref:Uncharacterized protein n=1 Tax=Timema podura TaxID=61482 RepID=A0ABN7NFV4_TIMPD|nr:unnamed protein product [Timema podura]